MAADSVDYKAANGQRISMHRMGRSAMVALQGDQNDQFHFAISGSKIHLRVDKICDFMRVILVATIVNPLISARREA